MRLRPNITTIAPNLPFLDVLAAWWLEQADGDMRRVADGLFLLPTRRAARALSDAFLRASGGAPLLLPRLIALGGVDESKLTLTGALSVLPAVPEHHRAAILTRFILAMNGAHGAPREVDRAWVLALELAALLDEAARAEIDLAAALPHAAGGDFAAHWNVTIDFLRIITERWPLYLAEAGYSDIAARESALLDAQAEDWRTRPPATPVIAAGSTGAIPAVARLLRVVAHLPQGMVVLPGLDQALSDQNFDSVQENHPQASLRALLSALNATRADVGAFPASASAAKQSDDARSDAWRAALLPAAALSAWQGMGAPSLAGISRLDPAHPQEEAQAIALVLRAALQVPGKRAALITPDRGLAQRVAAELLRFDIIADDSAGELLAQTPGAVFIRLIAAAAAEALRPVPLLSVLKHPYCAAGLAPAGCRAAARRLERAVLRGARPAPGFEGLRAPGVDRDFLARLEDCLRPCVQSLQAGLVQADAALVSLLEAAEALAATDAAQGPERLWAGEDGEALAQHFSDVRAAFKILPPLPAETLPALLEASFAGATVRSRRALRGRDGAEHPRIHIWGLLEARLQTADVLVLGGLSEGTWPPVADSGPWMNRAMRAAMGLPSPEEKIGLASHDFTMAVCAASEIVLSAPRRRDGAPAVPSRWLVRMEAFLAGHAMRIPLHPAGSWADLLDRPDGAPRPVSPPAPAPALALRPRRLSVTEIETWLADPYAIYAKHVLRLKKLDPLEQSADAADYGQIVHAGLHAFFDRFGLSWPADAPAQMRHCMEQALIQARMRPALAVWWRPRLYRIADWVANEEADRRVHHPCTQLRSEVPGSWEFAAPAGTFTLFGRADRIERRADGTLAILDYKTGKPPSGTEVEQGRAPQLPLEAAMAREGAFGADLHGRVTELVYWKISGGDDPGEVKSLFKGHAAQADKTASVADLAAQRLQALVAAFDDPLQPYLSHPSPDAAPRFAEYAHLARVAEWAVADEKAETGD